MAVVKIPEANRVIEGLEPVREFLATQGIEYERTTPGARSPPMRRRPSCSTRTKKRLMTSRRVADTSPPT